MPKKPAKALALTVPDQFSNEELMQTQFAHQYLLARDGNYNVMLFGCMMSVVRSHIISTSGKVRTGGKATKGTGIKAWVEDAGEKNGVKIALSTAVRFEDYANAVKADFKLPDGVDFALLVTTPREQLPEKLQKSQDELRGFVSGTDRKSFLDRFKPPKKVGGNQHAKCPHCEGDLKSKDQQVCPHCKKPTHAEPSEDTPESEALDLYVPLIDKLQDLLIDTPKWANLPAAQLIELDRVTIAFRNLRNQGDASK